MAANAAAAASALRMIYLANIAYAKNHPHEGYPRRLSDVSEGPGNTEHFWAIDPALASGEKQGYRFTYSSQGATGDGKLDVLSSLCRPSCARQDWASPFVRGSNWRESHVGLEAGRCCKRSHDTHNPIVAPENIKNPFTSFCHYRMFLCELMPPRRSGFPCYLAH